MKRLSQQAFLCAWLVTSAVRFLSAQGLAPATPAQEFIRLNGQVVAIENNPAGSAVSGAPTGWLSSSLGGALAGSVSYSSANANTYTVTGSGTGILQPTDQMQIAYIPLSNDVAITAHLASFSNTSSSALAGIVLRDSTDPGAVELFVGTAGGTQAGGLFRSAPNSAGIVFDPISGSVPSWFRLQRFGDTIFAYISSDGITWTQTGGEQRLPMHPNLVAGLVVSSGAANTSATATFDHVTTDRYPPFFSLASFMAGDYFFLANAASGKVLDVPGGNKTDGSTLQEWGLNNGASQQWALLMRADGLFTVQNNNSSLVLSLSGSTVTQSSQQWRDDQAFTMRANDGATVSFVNKSSGLALVFNGTIDSQPLAQAPYDPTQANQRWTLTPAGYFKMFLPYTAIVTSPNTPGTLTGSVSMAVNAYGYGAYGLQAYNSSYQDAPQVLLNGQPITNFPSGTYSGGFTVSNVTEGAQLVTTEASMGFVLESETLHLFQVLS